MIDKFGTCIWQPACGTELVHAEDIEDFPHLAAAVFHCVNADSNWLTVEYGEYRWRVSKKIFKIIPAPIFLLGQEVFVPAKNNIAKVVGLTWHFKDSHHIYYLSFNGKKTSRRYIESEILSVQK